MSYPRYFPFEESIGQKVRSIDQREWGAKASWKFKYTLIEKDKKRQKSAVQALTAVEGGILAAAPGKGKTIMALAAAARTQRRAFVAVPTTVLLDQWIKRILQATDLKREDVGVVQGDVCQWDRPIIVGMVPSLASRKYVDSLYRSVGVLIVDEVHKMGAPEFLATISQFPARIRWGLSATVERRDKMHRAFMYHIGPIVYKMLELDLQSDVWMLETGITIPVSHFTNVWNNNQSLSRLHSAIAKHRQRNEMLRDYLHKAAESGRKILALSRRIEQLEWFYREMNDRKGRKYSVGIIGGTHAKKSAEREAIFQKCNVILGIEQVAGFGLDQENLDTLFWLSPSQNVEQNVGRIEREFEGKKSPLVVDPVDANDMFRGMARARARKYAERKYQVHTVKGRTA